VIAVGLGSMLYTWSERQGVVLLHNGSLNPLENGHSNNPWLTSLAFSSTEGCKSVLAFGRSDGTLTLLSLYDNARPRFQLQQPCPIACLSWKPLTTLRQSKSPYTPGQLVKTEDLLVGDEVGNIYYYTVEWPSSYDLEREQNPWLGMMIHVATVSIHNQQICGLSWSADGVMLATGGNDNICCLFEASKLLHIEDEVIPYEEQFVGGSGLHVQPAGRSPVRKILPGAEKHRLLHGAAVKAIAFCPWFPGLVATGGGSNDKCIHFYHASSGSTLATISVAAQVTSLIWSTTRREIVATFGFAQPEHPYRIAVFSWPDCKQVAAIPWEGDHRALYAISYPGGPNEMQNAREGGNTSMRTAREGCIVVAASDESVKFHEVWALSEKTTVCGEGVLGGSDILEGLAGIDKEGDIIR
jgi:meiosis-specific APC/C activator protein AMA1